MKKSKMRHERIQYIVFIISCKKISQSTRISIQDFQIFYPNIGCHMISYSEIALNGAPISLITS